MSRFFAAGYGAFYGLLISVRAYPVKEIAAVIPKQRYMTATPSALAMLERYRPLVDREMARLLTDRPPLLVYEIIGYHLGINTAASSGKRVRAALCLLSCEALGGTAEVAAPAAAALELCHAFTLLHDDIADADETRRGRPTAWIRWGAGQAMTAGDALFALANLAADKLAGNDVPAHVVVACLRELNQAILTVCEGQQLDLLFEGRNTITQDDYFDMTGRKTAALMSASCAIGARVAGAEETRRAALAEFGREVGLAFQIQDDILGIWGDPAVTGKPVGGDLRRNKRSLPVIYALQHATPELRATVAEALAKGVSSDTAAAGLAADMEAAGIRTHCAQLAREGLARGLSALARAAPAPTPAQELAALSHFLVARAL